MERLSTNFNRLQVSLNMKLYGIFVSPNRYFAQNSCGCPWIKKYAFVSFSYWGGGGGGGGGVLSVSIKCRLQSADRD